MILVDDGNGPLKSTRVQTVVCCWWVDQTAVCRTSRLISAHATLLYVLRSSSMEYGKFLERTKWNKRMMPAWHSRIINFMKCTLVHANTKLFLGLVRTGISSTGFSRSGSGCKIRLDVRYPNKTIVCLALAYVHLPSLRKSRVFPHAVISSKWAKIPLQ